jgi:hypothetical protein
MIEILARNVRNLGRGIIFEISLSIILLLKPDTCEASTAEYHFCSTNEKSFKKASFILFILKCNLL